MKLTETSLPGVKILESPVHGDSRGFFTEVFHSDKFAPLGLPTVWAQDNHSRSTRGTLRGLHYQLNNPQGKLIRAVAGEIFDVAVDIRRHSPNFRAWVGVTLRGGDGRQLYVPPGFAHGFLVLSDFADVAYKCTTVYDPASDRSVRWDSASIAIEWPLRDIVPSLSEKDLRAPDVQDAELFD